MIVLRNTHNPFFEEAYLSVRDNADREKNFDDLLSEANNLIDSHIFRIEEPKKAKKVLWFLLGAVCSLITLCAIYFVFLN